MTLNKKMWTFNTACESKEHDKEVFIQAWSQNGLLVFKLWSLREDISSKLTRLEKHCFLPSSVDFKCFNTSPIGGYSLGQPILSPISETVQVFKQIFI